ncbi:hypothetical protein DFJ63DRAFT_310459 [Scheffersomyces coipomensis]|uniref:uncharacterized protein n=1 Tax=Scheffersomyces coipomensis TaxID=1788519 RepID=UPI00315CFEDB
MVTINDTIFTTKPSTTDDDATAAANTTTPGKTVISPVEPSNNNSNTLDITSSFSDPESGNGDDGSTSSSGSNHNSQSINHTNDNNNNNDNDINNNDIEIDHQEEYIQSHHDDDPLLDFVDEIPLLITDHDVFSDEDSFSIRSSIDNHFKQEEEQQKQQRLQFQLQLQSQARFHRPTTLSHEITNHNNNNIINGNINHIVREGTPATSIPASSPMAKQDNPTPSDHDVDETIVRKPPPILTEQIRESIIASKIIEKQKQEQLKKQQSQSQQDQIQQQEQSQSQSQDQSVESKQDKIFTKDGLTFSQFKQERNQLMSIIIKYIATKIHNSFPPERPKMLTNGQLELSLDKFLLLLTSRLKLNLTMFMKGIIYLFRYMDIIYLLRYLNQTNNFVNYNDMGFELKKLIIGCFKLAILREKKISSKDQSQKTITSSNQTTEIGGDQFNFNWSHITGLPNSEINQIVKTIMNRMNGKLLIKDVELVRLKSEIFRFVKMVATEV